ncbi:RNA polymerase recycling motor HelD [Natranaerobius thermophilus]|uniref:DNA 3'-5' helicase n=1 Tax=Natranaerobius thermophilus (strain ATCC BAA-1301 / DSM 18059 / JW/NM-WN-LF) TaxID=457570 RepID=B2A8B4_NATTJ|nr:RNA polymerase recycling motor HelD [Natranaerobius thermophilus]ACB84480.1 superfamily I DNA helicase [Natranaerobius thermophilus JW/NM-WN-LF]
MSELNHPDYNEELDHLERTKSYMDHFINEISNKQQHSAGQIKEAYEILDFLDSSQSYITILVNARYLDHSTETVDKVKRAKSSPYFSRIDFRDHRDEEPKSYYIGKLSLFKEDNEPVIIDWRSPIASLYYEGRLGEVSYKAYEGEITGELSLKRQYTIENEELQDFFDVDITTTDELLQASLRGSADNKLKDIVSTIQAEQNQVIRADLNKPLIVQGTAGSGKTTIALHRIAYLIYTYEKSFNPENFMIIAPNKLFLDYISNVLPDLGVEEAKQTTFTSFCFELLEIKEQLTLQDYKLSTLLENYGLTNSEKDLIKWRATFKGSMTFKKLIDNYICQIEQDLLPKEGIELEGYSIMSKDEITTAFMKDYSYLPLFQRIDHIKKKLSTRAKQQKSLIIQSIQSEYEQKIDQARKSENQELGRKNAVALMEERDQKIARVKQGAGKIVSKYTKQFSKKNYLTHYKNLMKTPSLLKKFCPGNIDEEKVNYLSKTAKTLFKHKQLELEDLAPLLYIKANLEGFSTEIESTNVIIDEAQDFSLFQLHTLKYVLNTKNFTLLGDLSQGIHAYRSIKDWETVNNHIFDKEATSLSLQQSYRTTVEIMNLANQILEQSVNDNVPLARPVVRHGKKPENNVYTQIPDLIQDLAETITKLQSSNYNSIAIIGKTMNECETIKQNLQQQRIDLPVLTGSEEDYQAGAVIIPSYATKGLEFDTALIVNLEEEYQKNELDAKLLYVSMTRAMHELYIFNILGKIEFLN